eukprot:569669-Prymnesium_polylepis.1
MSPSKDGAPPKLTVAADSAQADLVHDPKSSNLHALKKSTNCSITFQCADQHGVRKVFLQPAHTVERKAAAGVIVDAVHRLAIGWQTNGCSSSVVTPRTPVCAEQQCLPPKPKPAVLGPPALATEDEKLRRLARFGIRSAPPSPALATEDEK